MGGERSSACPIAMIVSPGVYALSVEYTLTEKL